MKEPSRETQLIEQLKPFVHSEMHKTSVSVVQEWITQSLTGMLEGRGAGAFSPFNEYFQTPRELRPSFAKMVEIEFAGVKLNQIDAVRILVHGVQGALDNTLHHEGRPMLDSGRIAPQVFDLLDLLFDLEPDKAYRWATRAVRDAMGFAKLRGPNGAPAPMALYFASPASSLGGGGSKDSFERAIFDWCTANADQSGVVSICLTLLPRVLESVYLYEPKTLVPRQIEVLERLSQATTSDGQPLPQALDALAWRYASVEAGESVDAQIGVETHASFRKTAERLADTFAPGLHDRLDMLGMAEFNGLVEAASPKRKKALGLDNASQTYDFGDGDMLGRLVSL